MPFKNLIKKLIVGGEHVWDVFILIAWESDTFDLHLKFASCLAISHEYKFELVLHLGKILSS